MTSSITAPVGGAITRASLYEYVIVLEQIQAIYQAISASASTATPALLQAQARQLAALNEELHQMETMSLIGAPLLASLAQNIINKLQPLTVAVYSAQGGNIASLASSFGSDTSVAALLQNALNPNNWSQTPGLSGAGYFHILDAPQDYAFYELYRTVEAGMNNSIGLFGNSLQAADEMLQGLNLINTGPTWNPGSDYINTQGMLQDLADGTSWFTQYQVDNISNNILQGMEILYTVQQGGYFPSGSAEGSMLSAIIAKVSGSLSAGTGYDYAQTEAGALAMWNDTAFRVQLQNGVELITNLNDTAQNQMQRVLLVYQEVTQTMTKLNTRISDQLKKIAKKMGPQG